MTTNDELRAIAEAAKGRREFLRQRSVEISAFEARTQEDDDRLWAEAIANAALLWPKADEAYAEAFDSRRAIAACDLADAAADLADYPQSPEALSKLRAAVKAWKELA